MRWKPRSPSAISESARLRTIMKGTCSSPPEADLARTPVAAGLWRAVVMIASTPKAAAVRTIAPTLCGSVIWSRARTTRVAAQGVEGRRGQGIGLEIEALVNGVGLDEPVDLVRPHDLGLERQGRAELLVETAGRVLRREEAAEPRLPLRSASATGCQP